MHNWYKTNNNKMGKDVFYFLTLVIEVTGGIENSPSVYYF